MNNKLDTKKTELNARAQELVTQATELDKQINKLLSEKEQVKRNFDAVSGALQLIEDLIANDPVVDETVATESPKLELVQ